MNLHLDTHVVVWLYAGQSELFSESAKKQLDRSRLLISPVVFLELQCLFEIGKISVGSEEIIADLEARIGLSLCHNTFSDVVQAALPLTWTRDPFDRLIVAQAKLNRATLLTKDRMLHRHYAKTLW